MKFECVVKIENVENGTSIHVNALTETDSTLNFDIWIVSDETGLYTISVSGENLSLQGIGKLESLPHLAMLESDEGEANLVAAVFEMPEVYGSRGFYKVGDHRYTFELALRARVRVVQETNENVTIIPFDPRRRE